jgi:hypothetical protein
VVFASEAFGDEGAWVRNVGQTRVYGEGAGIVDKVVNGLCIEVGAAGGGGSRVGL